MTVGNARPDWPLSILMTNICLTRRSGTEIATRDLAIALRRLGHRVAIYSPTLGPFALDVMARGIPVTNRIDAIGFTPDIIHGHHNVAMAPALIRFPETPGIFVCHDSSSPLDEPLLLGRIGAYVAVDVACVERMVVDGVDEAAITVIPNGVDLDTYELRTRWAERPRAALLVRRFHGSTPIPRPRPSCRSSDGSPGRG
jgi:glycosyltransferase involved in cell wall biosynthesis